MLANMTQEQTDRENREHCKRIAEEIEAIAEGKFYRCPDCGELYEIDDDTDDDGPHTCPNCGSDIEYPEQATLYDYFSDVYDIEYRIGGNGEFRSVRLMVACGGPNIYVDTGLQSVELYWWSDRASYGLTSDACDQIDSEFEELYACTR